MPTRRLVIDASVARAAGTTEHPISKANRDFLGAVLKVCHEVVMTPEMKLEWDQHQSYWAKRWRSSMIAGRKLNNLPETQNILLRDRIGRSEFTLNQRRDMEEDAPLIEAALAADRIVVSRDEEARTLFRRLAANCHELRDVIWLRPDESPAEALEWLRRGAKPVRKWQLGAVTTPR